MLLIDTMIAETSEWIGLIEVTTTGASAARMAVLASLIGAVAVVGGLFGSLTYDTPSGPSIVVAALILFILSLLPVRRHRAVMIA